MKTTSEVFYKVLGLRGKAMNGGRGRWPLPHDDQPGKWVEVAGPLVACQNGLHVCRLDWLILWLGPTIWRVEIDGERIEQPDKIIARRGRLLDRCDWWNKKSARLFAVACARRALEREQQAGREPDIRSWNALTVATAHANGLSTKAQLAAAEDAARDAWAARAAGATRDAAWAAWAAARDAAWTAAGDAAWAARATTRAAWAATRDAAWAAERQWQITELKKLAEKTSDLPF